MMSEERYFKVEYDEEGYLFDSNTISEELVVEQAEYGYGVFANSLSPSEICERLNEQQATIQSLKEDNDTLRELIKKYVFGRYVEGSLEDLKFKAIAYDDIVKVGVSHESEPKVIVTCKPGKGKNVKSFCQMFIPFAMDYEIKELEDE